MSPAAAIAARRALWHSMTASERQRIVRRAAAEFIRWAQQRHHHHL
jgi:predicted Fe-S protein YdhL (DUF1289 family)